MQNQSKLEVTFDTRLKTALKCSSELINFPLSVSPSKENARLHEAKKNISEIGGNRTHALRIFSDRPLLYRVSYETRREQVVGDCGAYCGNANMKGTKKCCATST